ncbi:hypothetical protein C8F04DRAFT_1396769 [Mycena alexandri]|uniref:Uncharacterized protein n=1 Tax=Mycena alexandri TaxID=1745969 RepID=A0AAD6SR82_9AGAR|nr:hypothetical protein C8F04DRAFT_1396769 [Mycena alexandri]
MGLLPRCSLRTRAGAHALAAALYRSSLAYLADYVQIMDVSFYSEHVARRYTPVTFRRGVMRVSTGFRRTARPRRVLLCLLRGLAGSKFIRSPSPRACAVEDSFLQRAASSIPKHALFLIEVSFGKCVTILNKDISTSIVQLVLGTRRTTQPVRVLVLQWWTCRHFYRRGFVKGNGGRGNGEPVRSLVTLSGLLNVINGEGE